MSGESHDETLKRAEAFLIEEIARRVSDQHTYGFSVSDAFGRRLDPRSIMPTNEGPAQAGPSTR